MLGAFGLIDSDRIDRTVMDNTLQLVEECWKYPTLWGWDFAMMAMTAVRLGKPEKAIELLLKESPKNCYVTSGNNRTKGPAVVSAGKWITVIGSSNYGGRI